MGVAVMVGAALVLMFGGPTFVRVFWGLFQTKEARERDRVNPGTIVVRADPPPKLKDQWPAGDYHTQVGGNGGPTS
jgi:hypothetical protein